MNLDEVLVWSTEEEDKKKALILAKKYDYSKLDLPGKRPEVYVTEMFRGIRGIMIHGWDTRSRMMYETEKDEIKSWWADCSSDDFIFDMYNMDIECRGEISNVDTLLRMYRLCPAFLDGFQIDLLRIAASVKPVLDPVDIASILSDLKACREVWDGRMQQEEAADDPLFHTDEQKLAIIQALQVEDLFFHKGAPKEEYPYEFVIAFRRKIDDAVVEVWITVPLYLVNEDKTISVDVSFYRD